jgi:hypothetical protein
VEYQGSVLPGKWKAIQTVDTKYINTGAVLPISVTTTWQVRKYRCAQTPDRSACGLSSWNSTPPWTGPETSRRSGVRFVQPPYFSQADLNEAALRLTLSRA